MKGITTDMPPDAVLIRADLIKVGDRVRFRMPSVDYTVEAVDIDSIGNVRHRADKPATMTCSYRPGELLWITRRADRGTRQGGAAVSDRELLELAAKAAGIEGEWSSSGLWHRHTLWNPLTDDGDALRLAVKLGIAVQCHLHDGEGYALAGAGQIPNAVDIRPNDDPYAATRRAIVRAAAELGRNMP